MKDWCIVISWVIDRWEQFWDWFIPNKRKRYEEKVDRVLDAHDESGLDKLLGDIEEKRDDRQKKS